jgi:large subunit ribosomal protein L6
MSRIGKKPIQLPAKVEITVGTGNEVTVKGPKGTLTQKLPDAMTISNDGGVLTVTRPSDEREHRALHGLTRALLNNMVTGVSTGFRKTLIVEGVGYRAEMDGKTLVLYIGYSHPMRVEPPAGITFSAEERGRLIHIDGADRQVVGQVAAEVRARREPEPYLGKGIRYSDEVIRRKEGKSGKGK